MFSQSLTCEPFSSRFQTWIHTRNLSYNRARSRALGGTESTLKEALCYRRPFASDSEVQSLCMDYDQQWTTAYTANLRQILLRTDLGIANYEVLPCKQFSGLVRDRTEPPSPPLETPLIAGINVSIHMLITWTIFLSFFHIFRQAIAFRFVWMKWQIN